jgi:hypothetical protein
MLALVVPRTRGAGERESWTSWLATLSLLPCGSVPNDTDAVEDGRDVRCAQCSETRRMFAAVLLWRSPAK